MGLIDEKKRVCKIKVIGVGGAGNNAVNRMIDLDIDSAEFVAVNTDSQALMLSKVENAENRIIIGENLTGGLGAGSDPEIGEKAAEESKAKLEQVLEGVNLLFIAAGMGGGTGTGAAPVIARIAKEKGCVTVAVVTKPFAFEGRRREENAKLGIANLEKYVDTIVVIPNDKLLEALPENVSMIEALKYADDTLRQGICGIADLISTPALINLDFADVRTIIQNQGLAHMGIGRAKGEDRVVEAVRKAVSSPLLETTIEGAKGVILNVTGGKDITLGQIYEAAKIVQGVVDYSANIIFGANIKDDLQEEIEITVIATGFENKNKTVGFEERFVRKEVVSGGDTNAYPVNEERVTVLNDSGSARVPVVKPSDYESEEFSTVEKTEKTEKIENQGDKKDLPSFMRKLFGKK